MFGTGLPIELRKRHNYHNDRRKGKRREMEGGWDERTGGER